MVGKKHEKRLKNVIAELKKQPNLILFIDEIHTIIGAGAAGTQLSKIHAAHSLGATKKQILRHVIFPNSLPEILTGIRVAVGMCWGTLVAAEFLAGTTGIGFVENVAKKYFQYEVIWITIFIMGLLGLLFDITLRKIIDKTIPWRGKG